MGSSSFLGNAANHDPLPWDRNGAHMFGIGGSESTTAPTQFQGQAPTMADALAGYGTNGMKIGQGYQYTPPPTTSSPYAAAAASMNPGKVF